MTLKIADFYPFNKWAEDKSSPPWEDSDGDLRERLTDESTGRSYWNQEKGHVRIKCGLLTVGTPLFHLAAAIGNIAYRICKLLTFYHFWPETDEPYSLSSRLVDAGADVLRILLSPLAIPFLELAALYGLMRPYDGRKLYASIERGIYGRSIAAPCFQPDPTHHLFGGDPASSKSY